MLVGAHDIDTRRRAYDNLARRWTLAADVARYHINAGGVGAEFTGCPGTDRRRVVIYLHGGGYVAGSLCSHRHLAAEIGRACGALALAVDYRLAPEHPYPAAIEDTLSAYRFLLNRGIAAGSIAIAGDGAGGGLAVASLVAIMRDGLPQPACAWVISPWTDMSASGETVFTRRGDDQQISRSGLLDDARRYLAGADPDLSLVSPIRADLRGAAPLIIQAGAREALLDDALGLARAGHAADVPVMIQVWSGMMHAWPFFHQILAAGRRAIAIGGAHVRGLTNA